MHRPQHQQAADHQKEDHQGRLGEGEEAAAALGVGACGGVLGRCGVEHLAEIMTRPKTPGPPSTRDGAPGSPVPVSAPRARQGAYEEAARPGAYAATGRAAGAASRRPSSDAVLLEDGLDVGEVVVPAGLLLPGGVGLGRLAGAGAPAHGGARAARDRLRRRGRPLLAGPRRRSTVRVVMKSSQASPSTPNPAQALGLKAVLAIQATAPVRTSPAGTKA